jgi:hypothetical protein
MKKKIKLIRRKVDPHVAKCTDICNRLQHHGQVSAALQELAREANLSPCSEPYQWAGLCADLMERVDCKVETLQINYPDNTSFRVCMTYTDRKKKPLYGHIFPVSMVVHVSPSFVESVSVAYVKLAKQIGFFP